MKRATTRRKLPRKKGKELVNAIPNVYNGVQMESIAETTFAKMLDENELAWSYETEDCKINLVPPFTFQGEKIRGMNYTCDFSVISPKGNRYLVEIKGRMLDSWLLKAKWIRYTIFTQRLPFKWLVARANNKSMREVLDIILNN